MENKEDHDQDSSKSQKEKVLEEEIIHLQKSLIQKRKELLQERTIDFFLYFCHIRSPSLKKELRNHKEEWNLKLILDSVEDAEYVCYFVDFSIGKFSLKFSYHTNPLIQQTLPAILHSPEELSQAFIPSLLNKKKELKNSKVSKDPKDPKDSKESQEKKKIFETSRLLEVIFESKYIDEKTWNEIKDYPDFDFENFLLTFFSARFLGVASLVMDNDEMFPACITCTCVQHYIVNKSKWFFPCLGMEPF